jgi:3',5'-cyclic AMP phosphodiesterase CpdA
MTRTTGCGRLRMPLLHQRKRTQPKLTPLTRPTKPRPLVLLAKTRLEHRRRYWSMIIARPIFPEMSPLIASIGYDFDYDGNTQGGRTAGEDAEVIVVAIGHDTAQYVAAAGTIARQTGNNVSLVAALERNYSNP